MKLAILSDIHSAADHYEAGLAAARAEGFDRLIILGDLFTYGPEPARVMDLTLDAIDRDGAVLIAGNHDQMYLELAAGHSDYAPRLQEWIRESVEWTVTKLDSAPSLHDLPWQEEWSADGVLIAHANPFGFGDWTYLTDDDRFERACVTLSERGFGFGLFGHTHRFRVYEASDGTRAATVGSIGQPRTRGSPTSEWALLTIGDTVELDRRVIDLGWGKLQADIRASSLSPATQQRLCEYFH